jgi:hypothetical protein
MGGQAALSAIQLVKLLCGNTGLLDVKPADGGVNRNICQEHISAFSVQFG